MTWAAVLLALGLVVVPARPVQRRGSAPSATSTPAEAAACDPHAIAGILDLLAACVRGGATVTAAAHAVAAVAPEPVASSLTRAGALLALGADPDAAWAPLAEHPATESVARVLRRSARSGTSVADALTDAAAAQRSRAEDEAVARADRAGVLITGPLGLCFLPAFVCLGIVPVVVGLAGSVLQNGGVP
ncbi:type II secretion system F family protein [Rhodococcoides corynebacterioides]|uniref:Type II secretion system F family protein n=1 Tax=Rhodococcoides corynebacterioides TaxID=53972 RepID=A0ABS7P3I6_9NOCA|nr:type II secretion system F family protein [Rhodococcus corynebacterioides]MBY6366976.1 type II secretion system F family protein [Rhodococcus corynebacterioides]MBY6407778.1 type II secretion system F family protein [Rhodococcus corynebacterioides]